MSGHCISRIRVLKVLLLAEEAAGLRVLRSLTSRNLEIAAVVTTPAEAGSLSSIEDVARRAGCPVWRPMQTGQNELGDRIRNSGVDVLLNVHSLHILDASVINAPKIGSFNLHPGPLPEMAGLNAPSWAVYLGNRQHAVTLHWMKAGIDTGAIVFSKQFALDENETGLTVSNTCVKLGVPLIESLLDIAAENPDSIPAHPQNTGGRRVFRRDELPNNGRIEWSNSAREIIAFVRAADYGPFPSPWGHPKTRLGKLDLEILKASTTDEVTDVAAGTVLTSCDEAVAVASGDRVVLLQKVQLDGKPANACEFIKQGDVLR